jgi:hypothetical protein
MKRILFTGIVLFFVLFGKAGNGPVIKLGSSEETGLQIVTKSGYSFEAINRVSEVQYFPVKTTAGDFIYLRVPGYSFSMQSGSPKLPVLKSMMQIPQGAQVSVQIISWDEEIIDLNNLNTPYRVFPVQRSVSKSEDPAAIPFEFNKKLYSKNSFVSQPVVHVENLGVMRGVRLGRVEVSPFQYNPVTNQLKVLNNIRFEIVFHGVDEIETEQMRSKYFSPAFEKNFEGLLNYRQPVNKDVITKYPQKMVVVSDPMFQTQLQPYIQWKTKKGFIVVEAYTNNPAVGNTTATIKAYLQNLYLNGTPASPAPTYVLFVGDVAQVPVFTGTTSGHVTDLYYCTYDGATDYYPDVYFGRFSATNSAQLQPQIDKTLEYEQYLFPSDLFLNDVVLVAGDDANFGPTHGNGHINYGTSEYFNLAHGVTDHTWLYPASTSAAAAIKSRISEGCSFLNFTAHCGPSGWAGPNFTVSDVAALTNTSKYPLSIGNCCSSNEFQIAECFGEALMRAQNKGAIGHIGGSNSTYWDEDYWWGVGYGPVSVNPTYASTGLGAFDRLFHDHGEVYADWFITSAQIMFAGNMAVTASGASGEKYYWEIYHLMGDPSLMPYISVPPSMIVDFLSPVPIGTISLYVEAEPHCYVAISENGVLLDAQYTGATNNVTLSFAPLMNPGNVDIVVTKQFRKPYIGVLDVVPGNTTNDAQVTQISVPATYTSILNADVQPTFTIRNLGSANLLSAQVGYFIDGGTPVTQPWSGSLTQYQTDVVTFPLITLTGGTHIITAFVSWPNGVVDEYHPGDTINKVFHVTAGDASVVKHNAFEEVYCAADSIIPYVIFTNKGTVDLQSVDVNYQINSGTVVTQSWTGVLTQNQQDTMYFPKMLLPYGVLTFTSFTSNPNGGSDENPSNDSKSTVFEVFSASQTVRVSILTDDYGGETTWKITSDVTGVVLYSGGPYADWDPQLITNDLCFGDGCYTFTILDSYGDGQQGYQNHGNYSVQNMDEAITYGSGSGNWGSAASVNFCINLTNSNDVTQHKVSIFPNPVSEFLKVSGIEGFAEIALYDAQGKLVYETSHQASDVIIDVRQFRAGIYTLQIQGELVKINEKLIIVR